MLQELYQAAFKFAGEKHKNQKVPGTNANYLLHIGNVAMEILVAYANGANFDVNYAVQVAILHDTIEDTNTTFEEVATVFNKSIADGVLALTKNEKLPTKKERMLDSLERINQLNKEVGIVKLADRITNLQKPPAHWSKEKCLTYLEEAKVISSALSEKNEYLNKRLLRKISEYSELI